MTNIALLFVLAGLFGQALCGEREDLKALVRTAREQIFLEAQADSRAEMGMSSGFKKKTKLYVTSALHTFFFLVVGYSWQQSGPLLACSSRSGETWAQISNDQCVQ